MMHRRMLLTGAALLLACGLPAAAQEAPAVPTGFIDKTLTIEGKSYPYVVYVPRSYTAARKWPVVVFLHGSGERGEDGLKQSQVGLGGAVRLFPERYPAVIVMPQCPSGQRFAGAVANAVIAQLDRTMQEYSIDADRQYLTGLSMGGYGTWAIASQFPERFAALAPVCGGGEPAAMAPKLKNVPIWVFHGDQDQAVPVQRSREMVEALKAAGSDKVKYTEYPGVGHNSWDNAYAEKGLAEWLFAQKRTAL